MKRDGVEKRKLNFVDVIFILVIVLIFAFVGLKGQAILKKALLKDSETLRILVELQQQDKEVVDHLKVGDTVRYNTKEKDTGKILSIQSKPAKKVVKDTQNGIYRNSLVPQKYDVEVLIETKGYETKDTVYAGSLPVTTGLRTVVRNQLAAAEGFVLRVEKVK